MIRRSLAILVLAALAVPAAAAHAQQPDQLTPVIARVNAEPQQVLADDGRRHLAYELELANRSTSVVTVNRIDTLAGGKVVASLRGKALAALMTPYAAAPGSAKLKAGQGGFVLMDASFPATGPLPAKIEHRLRISLKPAQATATTTYTAAPTDVVRTPAVVVQPPLRGPNWVVGNGCCSDLTAHRAALLPVNGANHAAERFAIDFIQADANGLLFSGPADALSSFAFFGDTIYSATAGTVVAVVDGLPEQVPGALPQRITAAQAGGNHIVVNMGGGRYAFYAHLQPGSPAVKVGDEVTAGQPLGLLGNSGNTDAPHLHFHIMDGPSPLASNGLPYRFSSFTVQGVLTNLPAFAQGAPMTLAPQDDGAHTAQLPLDNQVITFP